MGNQIPTGKVSTSLEKKGIFLDISIPENSELTEFLTQFVKEGTENRKSIMKKIEDGASFDGGVDDILMEWMKPRGHHMKATLPVDISVHSFDASQFHPFFRMTTESVHEKMSGATGTVGQIDLGMRQLSDDLWIAILQFLPMMDIVRLRRVCKSFLKCCDADVAIWKPIFFKFFHYPQDFFNTKESDTNKQTLLRFMSSLHAHENCGYWKRMFQFKFSSICNQSTITALKLQSYLLDSKSNDDDDDDDNNIQMNSLNPNVDPPSIDEDDLFYSVLQFTFCTQKGYTPTEEQVIMINECLNKVISSLFSDCCVTIQISSPYVVSYDLHNGASPQSSLSAPNTTEKVHQFDVTIGFRYGNAYGKDKCDISFSGVRKENQLLDLLSMLNNREQFQSTVKFFHLDNVRVEIVNTFMDTFFGNQIVRSLGMDCNSFFSTIEEEDMSGAYKTLSELLPNLICSSYSCADTCLSFKFQYGFNVWTFPVYFMEYVLDIGELNKIDVL